MPYTFAMNPYGSTEAAQDIRLVIRVMVEDSFGSNIYTEVKSQVFYPNGKGEVSFDVKNIIHAYLEYYMPNPNLMRPLQAINQRKRYRVDYLILKEGVIVGDLEETDVLNAVKGGIAYEEWHPKEFFTSLIMDQKQSLQFHPMRKVAFDELRYFFWIYPWDDAALQTVMIDILLDDQSTINADLSQKLFVGKWAVCCVPIGFNQLKLNDLVPADRTAISYTIQVKTPGTSIVAPVTFELEQRNFYNTFHLVYRNSLGGMETINMRGQVDFETDHQRQAIQRAVPPAYFSNMVLMHQSDDVNSSESAKYKGDTGFLNRDSSDRLRDFFLSPQKYEVLKGADGHKIKLLPITVITKNTKFFSNQENLVTTVIEWNRGYVNEYYSPNRLMPSVRACPALESFEVTQINKNLLQIMYALESPYDRVEIKVITTLGTQTFYFTGNARTIRQAFNNPVYGTTGNEDIIIEARCVCDEYSDPMDLGPVSTVNLNVVGNTLPIANDDNYSLAVGYNTAVTLPGSVLANDYDPDGDPIECVPDSGATADGGTFDIDIDGIIEYTPPSSVYSGTDSFDYEMQEVGGSTTVTATVYITVGTVAGAVYGKIVRRNVVSNTSGYDSEVTAEVWVDFFADPSGTTPLDVTGMGITFDVNEHQMIQDHNTGFQTHSDTAIPVIGVGTKVKFFENIVYQENSDPVYPYSQIFSLLHTLLPGTGYIVI